MHIDEQLSSSIFFGFDFITKVKLEISELNLNYKFKYFVSNLY